MPNATGDGREHEEGSDLGRKSHGTEQSRTSGREDPSVPDITQMGSGED